MAGAMRQGTKGQNQLLRSVTAWIMVLFVLRIVIANQVFVRMGFVAMKHVEATLLIVAPVVRARVHPPMGSVELRLIILFVGRQQALVMRKRSATELQRPVQPIRNTKIPSAVSQQDHAIWKSFVMELPYSVLLIRRWLRARSVVLRQTFVTKQIPAMVLL